MCEVSGVLNLSQLESLDDWDESRVRLAIGVDESSVTTSLPLEDRRDICKRAGTQQRTKNNTTKDKYQLD